MNNGGTKEKVNWIKEINKNYGWIKWVLFVVYSAVLALGGNYISYVDLKAKVVSIEKTVDLMYKTNEDIKKQFNIVIESLLNE